MGLFSLTLKGLKWTTLNSALISLIQLVRVIILTKLLSPGDYGIMAMVIVVTSFSRLFLDVGISSAIIYKKNIPDKELTSLYWINVFFGIFVFVVVYSLSDIFSLYIFNEKNLSEILKIVAFVFILNGFATQFIALLRKHLKFKTLAIVNITSSVINFIVTLILAYRGFGVYSLVIGYITESTLNSLLIVAFGLKIQKPKLNFSLSGIKPYFKFGFFQFSTRIVSTLGQQGDKILIGAFLSTETLGLYNVSKILITKPISFIKRIFGQMAFPVLTSIKDKKQLRKWSISAFKTTFLALTPILLLLIVFPTLVLYNLYGTKWLTAAPFLSVLSILFSIRILRTSFGPLLISKGKVRTEFKINFFETLLMLFVLSILLQFSIIHAIYGLIFLEVFVFQTIRFHLIMKPILNLSLKEFFKILYKTVTPLFFSIGVSSFLYHYLTEESYTMQIFIYITGLIIIVSFNFLLNGDLIKELKEKYRKLKL